MTIPIIGRKNRKKESLAGKASRKTYSALRTLGRVAHIATSSTLYGISKLSEGEFVEKLAPYQDPITKGTGVSVGLATGYVIDKATEGVIPRAHKFRENIVQPVLYFGMANVINGFVNGISRSNEPLQTIESYAHKALELANSTVQHGLETIVNIGTPQTDDMKTIGNYALATLLVYSARPVYKSLKMGYDLIMGKNSEQYTRTRAIESHLKKQRQKELAKITD